MPEKEGAEEKSTKSVVNKKQKQMMGEEGYDIARDQGRVRPSKDKKDATTLRKPPSEEMKKTQIVNTGPSAYELIKKKYKGQIMNVGKKGKKKVQDEFDLTQVAEAFGGYIVEAPVEDDKITAKPGEAGRTRKKISKIEKEITAPKPGEKEGAKKLISKTSSNNQNRRGRKSLTGNIPPEERGGEVDKDPDTEVKRRELSAQQDDKVRGEVSRQAKADAATDNLISKIRQGKTKAGEDASKVSSRRADRVRGASGGKKTGSLRQGNLEFPGDRTGATQQAKADIEARRGIKAAGGSGDIGFTAPNRKEKVQKRIDRAAAQGTPDPFDTPSPTEPIKPFGDKPVATGIQEPSVPKKRKSGIELTRPTADLVPKSFSDFSKKIKDLKVDRDIERRIENPKTASIVNKNKRTYRKRGGGYERLAKELGFNLVDPPKDPPVQGPKDPPVQGPKDAPVQGPRERGGAIIKRQPDSTAIVDQRPKRKQKSGEEIVRTLPRKNNTLPSLRTIDAGPIETIRKTGEVAIQKYSQFARNNPALGLATYDIGKGIIGKIMKTRMPAVVGGKAGFRSAGSYTAT